MVLINEVFKVSTGVFWFELTTCRLRVRCSIHCSKKPLNVCMLSQICNIKTECGLFKTILVNTLTAKRRLIACLVCLYSFVPLCEAVFLSLDVYNMS